VERIVEAAARFDLRTLEAALDDTYATGSRVRDCVPSFPRCTPSVTAGLPVASTSPQSTPRVTSSAGD
jgi:hypothetical protein